jgi:hypothetical protein
MSAWIPGSCHCGRVRFRVRLPDAPEALDCNCSICRKKGFLHLIVDPVDFVLEQGGDALVVYRFGTGVAAHKFCATCGIHPFYTPRSHPDRIDVNARCLDDDTLSRLVVTPYDGRNWEVARASLS